MPLNTPMYTSLSECNCFNHSSQCAYNSTVDSLKLSLNANGNYSGGGMCLNCQVTCKKCLLLQHENCRPQRIKLPLEVMYWGCVLLVCNCRVNAMFNNLCFSYHSILLKVLTVRDVSNFTIGQREGEEISQILA